MHVVAADPQAQDDGLIPAVDLTADLVTDWRSETNERHLAAHSPEPIIYRVGRPPFTRAAGVSAAHHATELIHRNADQAGTGERALIDTAFRIGLSTGAYATHHAMGYPLPTFPPPREAPREWLARFKHDLSEWLFTRLSVDPPPDGNHGVRATAGRYWKLAIRLRGKSRKVRSTTPDVRISRTYVAAPDVRDWAAMLMAHDAKTRRKARIAASLRFGRTRAGLTQEQLAGRTGTTRIRVNEWENAVHEPSPAYLEQLADALGVQPWWFLIDHDAETC